MGSTFSQLTSLSFHVNRASNSWVMTFSNLTLKIKGQSHGRGESWKSQHGSNIQSTNIPFVPCESGIRFQSYDFFKIWPWKLRVKVMGEVTVQSHNVGLTSDRLTSLSFHVKRASHSWVTTFSKFDLENQGSRSWVRSQFKVTMWVLHPIDSHPFYSMSIRHPIPELWLLKIWPWKSRVKVMGGVTVQSHNVGLTSYRFTSLLFHVNRPSHSWDRALQNLTLKIKCQGQMTMMLHNYRSRQFHRTLNGTDPSRGFRDMGSAKSGPSAAWFDKFLANGQAHMGQMGK